MARKLKYFAYISRAKVSQLHDQITDFAVEKRSVKRVKDAEAKSEAGSNALFGLLRGSLNLGGKYSHTAEETGTETIVQKLMKIIGYIEENETIIDLRELCERKSGLPLDGFCYAYSGKFFTLGQLDRENSDRGIVIPQDALNRAGDEIVISKSLLILPARKENAFAEVGPNAGNLVSNMAIITSPVGDYILSLACSFKYFSDMGGSWSEQEKEWNVYPHSGNHHFFSGQCDAWLESLIFINGIRGKTIMGSPLFLVHSVDPSLRL